MQGSLQGMPLKPRYNTLFSKHTPEAGPTEFGFPMGGYTRVQNQGNNEADIWQPNGGSANRRHSVAREHKSRDSNNAT
jgi:hypothetical protein